MIDDITLSTYLGHGDKYSIKDDLKALKNSDIMHRFVFKNGMEFLYFDGRIYQRIISNRSNDVCEMVHVVKYWRVTREKLIGVANYFDYVILQPELWEGQRGDFTDFTKIWEGED